MPRARRAPASLITEVLIKAPELDKHELEVSLREWREQNKLIQRFRENIALKN